MSDRSEPTAVRADRDHRSRLGYTDRMSVHPLAYHITFGTYGTRLHGDPRGTVDRKANKPGDPIIGAEPDWERMERSSLRFPAMLLTTENRSFIEFVVPSLCDRGGWELHVCAAKPDHVHVLLATSREAKPVRRWLKTWLSQALNECLGSEPPAVRADRDHRSRLGNEGLGNEGGEDRNRSWWSKGGSIKWVWDEKYFDNVYDYIVRQRITVYSID